MKRWKPYVLMAPALISFVIFVFWPLIYTFYLSFFDWNMVKPTKAFVGFANYIKVFTDPTIRRVMGNTMLYLLLLVVMSFILPYILSFVLAHILKKGRGFYRSGFFLPSVISLVISSILYLWILNPVSGPLALILKVFGITLPVWTKTSGWGIVVLSIITTWKSFGYNFIVLLGGILGVDGSIIEAAKLEGISSARIFVDFVLPMSSATGVFVFITSILQGLQFVFTPIKVLTQGGPNYGTSNIIYHSYHEAFTLYQTGVSSAISIVTLSIFIILLALEVHFVERGIYYEN
ncbi:MAG: sugar ABC transporter permease [Peptoniphilaceae bacterium]|nr:sugar ABC transporter permease [Peptoniphilaceae bacterium]